MCANHPRTTCPDSKPHRCVCTDCGRVYCSNLDIDFQCRKCYLLDEFEAGLL